MQVAERMYLNYIDLLRLDNWSVPSLLDGPLNYSNQFTLSRIGDFLIRNRNVINIDDHLTYKRVTVRINNNGVFLRDTEKGVNIGTKKQYLAKSGQFIVSRIDARNGAFGIITEELDGSIVTNDFPLYDVDTTKINIRFLLLTTTTKEFTEFAKSCSSGTTNRQRMDIDMFLNQKIPLPSIQEQESIVQNYFSKFDEAENLSKQASDLESEIEKYFLEQLGIEKTETRSRKKGLHIINLSELEKWGFDFVGASYKGNKEYKSYSVRQLCKISSGGTPSRSRKEYFNGSIPWIKTGELNNNVLTDTEEKITEEGLKDSSAKLYSKGCIVIAMYGATIGKTAKLGIDATTNQACAVLFDIDNSLIITDYLWEYIQSQTENLKKLAYGSAQPNLNAGIISNYLIPLPSIDKQYEIVNAVQSKKEFVKNIEVKAEQLKFQAKQEFEKLIFS